MSIWGREPETDKQLHDKEDVVYQLRLFVTGASPNSLRAITNTKFFCETYLKGKYELEIIDIYQQPLTAQKEQLVALPMLIKNFPFPQRKLIGDMSDTNKVFKGLGLENAG